MVVSKGLEEDIGEDEEGREAKTVIRMELVAMEAGTTQEVGAHQPCLLTLPSWSIMEVLPITR